MLINNVVTGMKEDGKPVFVKDLLKLLYEKACQQNLWGLVRHTAGMLGKRVEDLAKALTDLLVRQKQVNFKKCYSNLLSKLTPILTQITSENECIKFLFGVRYKTLQKLLIRLFVCLLYVIHIMIHIIHLRNVCYT